jgi:hypothetical protein
VANHWWGILVLTDFEGGIKKENLLKGVAQYEIGCEM